MPPQKRNTPFQTHHAAEFGLRICQHAAGDSTAVIAVACRFCEVFGKGEPAVGMKRSRSQGVKFFQLPFRKENYSSHHTRMHGPRVLPKRVLIDKGIVDVIIGDMMFHSEDMNGVSRARFLESSASTLDPSEAAQDSSNASRYSITIRNTKQFQLVAQYLAAGLSFRQVTQRIAELLKNYWAFSVALDMATHLATAYCDIRIRICYNSTVHDFHLLSVPVHNRHTGQSIFNTFSKAMDALFSDWRKTIVGASSDGEKKMTGRHQGVITRIQRVARAGFMRIWCGAHQLDLCMQSFYLAIPDAFYSKFTSLVAYLRRQQTFIADERCQCPLICDTRWLNMIKVTTWFDKHRLAVVAYLDEKSQTAHHPTPGGF
eukprot:IDg1131t1